MSNCSQRDKIYVSSGIATIYDLAYYNCYGFREG